MNEFQHCIETVLKNDHSNWHYTFVRSHTKARYTLPPFPEKQWFCNWSQVSTHNSCSELQFKKVFNTNRDWTQSAFLSRFSNSRSNLSISNTELGLILDFMQSDNSHERRKSSLELSLSLIWLGEVCISSAIVSCLRSARWIWLRKSFKIALINGSASFSKSLSFINGWLTI